MMISIIRLAPLLMSSSILLACAASPDADAPGSNIPSSSAEGDASVVVSDASTADEMNDGLDSLPDAIASTVKADLREEIGDTSLQIGRYSRETWSDGCLGLGGPAESCLAALTEGWQVEVIDSTGKSYFYRTDLDGNQIRRSTLEDNLPPSLRDRIFQKVAEQSLADTGTLAVIEAEPQMWDGCYGMPPADGVCPEIAILGWRAVVSDGEQSWVYHTDNSGDVIRLKN